MAAASDEFEDYDEYEDFEDELEDEGELEEIDADEEPIGGDLLGGEAPGRRRGTRAMGPIPAVP